MSVGQFTIGRPGGQTDRRTNRQTQLKTQPPSVGGRPNKLCFVAASYKTKFIRPIPTTEGGCVCPSVCSPDF